MKVSLVCYEDISSWILGRLTRCLEEELRSLGVDARASSAPASDADICHHVIYPGFRGPTGAVDTLMVTHVDTEGKVELLRKQLDSAAMAICMSADTVEKLAALGLPPERLCFANYPSPQKGRIERRRIHVGLTSKCYAHGSKREYLLGELAGALPADAFVFHFMGTGWNAVIHRLRKNGTEVIDYGDFDESAYRSLWSRLDYYLYLGQDEGSTGILDALEAGVPSIATPQGFHLDMGAPITHPINDLGDLREVFIRLAGERARLREAVEGLTWRRYAEKHLEIWEGLLAGKPTGDAPKRRSTMRLPAMPASPGPGGAVHRPRILVLAEQVTPELLARWQQLALLGGSHPRLLVASLGAPLSAHAYVGSPYLEVRLASHREISVAELAVLALDFDAVVFWGRTPLRLLHGLKRAWKPNYLARSEWIQRTLDYLDARPTAANRRLGSGLVAAIGRLRVRQEVRLIAARLSSDGTRGVGPTTPKTRLALRHVDLVIAASDELEDVVRGKGRSAVAVQGFDGPGWEDSWSSALTRIFETLAVPRAADAESLWLGALRGAQRRVAGLRRSAP